MKSISILMAILAASVFAGCGTLSVGGKEIVGVSGERDREGKPVPMFGTSITVHQYGVGGQVQPPPSPLGTPPSPPQLQPSGEVVPLRPVSYKTVYPSKWDDPTLVVIQNQSLRFVRINIDGAKEEIRLEPNQATADLHFNDGEHRLRVTVEKPTANFGVKKVERITSFFVRPEGHSQIVQIYDY